MEVAADAAIGTAVNVVADTLWRQIGYIWNYKMNMENLQQQLVNLKAQRKSMSHRIEEAEQNGQKIEDTATNWLKSADEEIDAAVAIREGNDTSKKSCFMGCLPNLKARYQFSKKANEKTPVLAQVQQIGGSIHKISYRPNVQEMEPVKTCEDLESRMEVLKHIVAALKDDDANLIGVYGLGGVGKSKFVKEQVVAQVKKEGLFKVVATANVTHSWNLSRIQQEIAESLGLKFKDDSTEIRAKVLFARLKQEKKVLVVLDDIWEEIESGKEFELGKIGIPSPDDHKGCKVLMTSRDLNVLMKMGVQRHFMLHTLQQEEAWQLFKKNAGDFKNSELQSVAIEVARKCAGLPILIMAVATSLRNKELYEWKDAVEHLQQFQDKGHDAKVYSALELSYKFLGAEHKYILVLCAQAGESIICITDLVKYARGSDLFRNYSRINNLRNRLLTVVDDLKRKCLLLEGDNKEIITMHDVVRNFTASIASKQHHLFTIASQHLLKWPEDDTLEQCTAISFPHCQIPINLPQVLDCPNLESFIFYNDDPSLKIPDKFFSTTKKLKIVDLYNVNLLPLPSSLAFLHNLQTLCLDQSVLLDISAVGQLDKLQVLSLIGSSIVQLPTEIKNLTRLQVLDLSDCQTLEVIPPGILICLTKLEVFSMLGTFVRWEGEGHAGKRTNASLSELKSLSKLNSLEIQIVDAKIMPVDLFHKSFERFRILIGENYDLSSNDGISKTLKLKHNGDFQLERVNALLIDTEDLYLDDLKVVQNVVPKLEREGFRKLKHLQIQNCHEMQSIIDKTRMRDIIIFPSLESLSLLNLNKLEKLYNGPFSTNCFNSLRKLKVENCDLLKNLK